MRMRRPFARRATATMWNTKSGSKYHCRHTRAVFCGLRSNVRCARRRCALARSGRPPNSGAITRRWVDTFRRTRDPLARKGLFCESTSTQCADRACECAHCAYQITWHGVCADASGRLVVSRRTSLCRRRSHLSPAAVLADICFGAQPSWHTRRGKHF